MSPAKEATEAVKGDEVEGQRQDDGIATEQKVSFKETALFKALAGPLSVDILGVVRDLIKGGADVNAKGLFQETYLHVLMAPRDEKEGIVKDEPAQATQQTEADEETLKKQELAARIITSLVYQLAQAGMKMNSKDQEGNTALHIASINDQPPPVITAMIRSGLDPCLLNYGEQDALDLADLAITREVLNYFEPGLWRAVGEDDMAKTKKLLASWCKIAITDEEGESLITMASDKEHFNIVAELKVSQPSNSLVHTALAGDVETLKDLVKRDGVDLNVVDPAYFSMQGIRRNIPLLGEVTLLGRYECAKVLVKKGADVNTMVQLDNNNKEPLYYYLLKQCEPVNVDAFKAIFKKADFSLVKKHHFELLKFAWTKKLDPGLVSIMVERGVSLGLRDEAGYTLRDIIVRDTCAQDEEQRRQALYYVDQHVIDMASEGRLDELQALATSGYSYILVTNRKGKTINKIVKKEKQANVQKFLDDLPKHKKKGYVVYNAILNGNLADVRDNMDETLAQSCDGVGRSPLHLSVLYERRFIIKWLLSKYPDCVKATDQLGRTALHYAYMVQEGQDIITMLQQANAMDVKDNKDNVPGAYKSSSKDKKAVESERVRPCGLDTLALDRYLLLRDCIQAKDTDRALVIIDGIVEFPLEEMMEVRGRFTQLPYQDLLFLCVQHQQEDTAIALIKAGMPYHHTQQVETSPGSSETLSLRDAAEKNNCDRLVKFLDAYKPAASENDDREAQLAFQAAMAMTADKNYRDNNTPDSDLTLPDPEPADNNDQPNPDVKNSSSCTIL